MAKRETHRDADAISPDSRAHESAAEWVALDALRPWGDNPRKNDGEPVRKVAESIKRFGFGAPIVARKANGEIIAGHTRWKAAQSLGLDRVPVRFVDLDPADAHLLALADNRVAEAAEWEIPALLEQLSNYGLDAVAAAGWSQEDLAKLAANIDPGPMNEDEPPVNRGDELRKEWNVESGQLWGLGDHRLLCGDSTKRDDVERAMGSDVADMMWTDPPYGVSYVGKTKSALTIHNDGADDLGQLLTGAFARANDVLRDGAAIYVAHPAGALSVVFGTAFLAAGWRIHQGLVWAKDSMVLGHSDYHYKHEPILYGFKPGGGRRGRGGSGWFGDNAQTSILDVPRPSRSEEHPTMKPVALVAIMISNSSAPGQVVYEPFSGSGTTLLCCEQLGRRCRAIEISPNYVAVTLQRFKDATGENPVLKDRPA